MTKTHILRLERWLLIMIMTQITANQSILRQNPSPFVAWLSTSSEGGNSANYVDTVWDQNDIVSFFEYVSEPKAASHESNAQTIFNSADVEQICVFLSQKLYTNELSDFKVSDSSRSFLQDSLSNSKQSMLLKHTIRSDSLYKAIQNSKSIKSSSVDIEDLNASEGASSVKNKLMIINLPNKAPHELDNLIKLAVTKLSSKSTLFALTADANPIEESANRRSRQLAESSGIKCSPGQFIGILNGKQFCFSNFVHMTPEILTGIIFGVLFIFLAYVGISALSGLQTPMRYPLHGPPKGKEF